MGKTYRKSDNFRRIKKSFKPKKQRPEKESSPSWKDKYSVEYEVWDKLNMEEEVKECYDGNPTQSKE